VPIANIVAQLNIDMVGRSKPEGDTNPANRVLTGPHEIYVVGSTKMSTDLQKLSESVNDKFLKLTFNYKYDDPKDPEGIFTRSDHYMYARKGIPIIFYFDGVHQDYHQPSDEVSKIDFLKMSNVARTVYATGVTLGNALKRPVVDKPLKG
jgi:Zn-dependent M28 family amino/carboxypeptidase